MLAANSKKPLQCDFSALVCVDFKTLTAKIALRKHFSEYAFTILRSIVK